MKFATFNLYQFLKPGCYWYERHAMNTYSDAEWAQKRQWVLQRLAQMNADVVGFQEVFSIAELETLVQEAGYHTLITVDQSGALETDPDVYVKPVVALASRVPVVAVHEVGISPSQCQHLLGNMDFKFSRKPVCVTLQTPDLGLVQTYVTHLKSKRPILTAIAYPDETPWLDRVHDTMQRTSCGNIAALLQRGMEASVLYHHVSAALLNDEHLPVVILGDLNDVENSTPLAALTMGERVYDVGGVDYDEWPSEAKAYLHRFRLNDTFFLARNMAQRKRPHTHLYRGDGTVLDYILVSNTLSNHNPVARAEIAHYQVLHDHLDEDGIPNRLQSDHGQVRVDIRAVVDYANLPQVRRAEREPSAIALDSVLTRQDFIDLAGGVYQSPRHFTQWDSHDKWSNFWSFFFDHDYGWVSAIYGTVPVDELYQKQRHSIEHIIPRSFLDQYFTQYRDAPRHVRNGASVNPFNFAPSERGMNAKRSSFAFDMEGDVVVRPEKLTLHPDSFVSTGLDADNEWVLPSRNRGDVARAILYMVLIYDIKELYTQHMTTLVHWAKVDSPSAWEMAYNQWVYDKHGIRNPFIDKPDNALKLLNNMSLLNCALCDSDGEVIVNE